MGSYSHFYFAKIGKCSITQLVGKICDFLSIQLEYSSLSFSMYVGIRCHIFCNVTLYHELFEPLRNAITLIFRAHSRRELARLSRDKERYIPFTTVLNSRGIIPMVLRNCGAFSGEVIGRRTVRVNEFH